jgi:adenine-specific DNA-methyltransferase
VRLLAINEIKGDLTTPGYSAPLTVEFLKAQPCLVIDTRFFSDDWTAQLVNRIESFENQQEGLLIQADNFDALNLLARRYVKEVSLVFIDPPYNTGVDGFPYKDSYQHASWLAMMQDRLELARALLSECGLLFCTIDFVEVSRLRLLMDMVFGEANFLAAIAWEKRYTRSNNAKRFYSLKDTVLAYRASGSGGRHSRSAQREVQIELHQSRRRFPRAVD